VTATATVLAPRTSGAAQRISPFTWRKLILPTGSVTHGGKNLTFSADYIAQLADAFGRDDRDYTRLQLSGGLDPEDFGGQVLDLDPQPNGLWAIIRASARADAMLASDPSLPVSAAISENYERSDGEFFPASLQSINMGSAIGLSNPGGQEVIDLSHSAWTGDDRPADAGSASAGQGGPVVTRVRIPGFGTTQELGSEGVSRLSRLVASLDRPIDLTAPAQREILTGYASRSGYGDLDAVTRPYLTEFSNTFQMVSDTELARIEQDAMPQPRRTEDRIATALDRIQEGTYVPRGQFAWEFASPDRASLTGLGTCDVADDLGFCRATTHQPGCGSAIGPEIVETVQDHLRDRALQGFADSTGRFWRDQYGSPATMTDFIEAGSGIRLADADPYSARPRRELARIERPVVYGDPDTPGSGRPFPAATMRTAQRLADASRGMLSTSADVARQRDAWAAQHGRLKARIGSPRHADFRGAELSNPVHRDTRLVPFENSILGSLTPYASAGTVSQGDEVWLA